MLEKIAPYFLSFIVLCIILEALYNSRANKGIYEKKDTIISLAFGLIGAVTRWALKGAILVSWIFLHRITPFKIETTVLSLVILYLLNELIYYWFHRISHERPFFWATHVNHHSSTKLNLAVATRTPFMNTVYHGLFWIPLPLMGFNPVDIFTMEIISFFFAFLPHTTVIRKLGILEYVLNTPSHHRVHHACNPQYLDKNYGNTLIIFDRLFGTFKEESEEPVFGLTRNPVNRNLFNMIFHGWIDYFRKERTIHAA